MSESFDLLSTVETGGCSAKLPAGELERLLKDIPILPSPNLLVGAETHDDASVFRLDDETALISTTDFFPPICSDPFEFGQIAAVNSLSDVYAMGGRPLTALNILLFPSDRIDSGVMRQILLGGAETVKKAGAVLSGGHTLDDYPPKYGLAVTGVVHPDRIIRNSSARPGEVLILTKALGTGVLVAGHRLGEAREEDYRSALESMKLLNREAAELMQRYGVRAATDVTGFSLLGHALEMAQGSDLQLIIESRQLPQLSGAYELLEAGCIPGAAFRNLRYTEERVDFSPGLDYNLKMLAADAQTSGGILLSAPAEKAEELLAELKKVYPASVSIGETKAKGTAEPYLSLL